MATYSTKAASELDASYDRDADFLRSVLSSSGDCIKVLDLDANLVYMSEGGRRVMEVSDFNQIRGCPWPDFWKDQGNIDARAAIATAKVGGIGRFTGHADTFIGTPRYWDVQVTPIFGPDGKPERLLSVSRDITAQHQVEVALRTTQERLNLALRAGRLGFWELDLKTGVLDASALCKENFGRSPDNPFTYEDLQEAVHPDDRAASDAAVAQSIETGDDLDVRYRLIRPGGEERWLLVQAKLQRAADGTPIGLAGISLDITEFKKDEALRKLLNQELIHRIKNQLAMVQSVVNQSLRGVTNIADAKALIHQRLEVLSHAHEALTRGRGEGANVRSLVETATGMHDSARNRVLISGPDVQVGPKAGLSLALVLHELATNAVKYGALSAPAGRIDISWAAGATAAGTFEFQWSESGGPQVEQPGRKGFGTRLIQGGIGNGTGDVSIDYRPDGLAVRFTAPMASMVSSD